MEKEWTTNAQQIVSTCYAKWEGGGGGGIFKIRDFMLQSRTVDPLIDAILPYRVCNLSKGMNVHV
jgi:hypothetical protein